MPYNRNKCSDEVKKHFKHTHNKCASSGRKGRSVTGLYLNQFLHHRPLNNDTKYHICYNMKKMIDDKRIIILKEEDRSDNNKETIINLKRDGAIAAVSPPLEDDNSNKKELPSARDERYARRALLQQQHHIQRNEIDEPPVMPPAPAKTPDSRGNERRYTPFQSRVLKHKQHFFKKTYKDLRWQQRKERLDDAVSFIIACCLERKKMGKDGKNLSYIMRNQSFLHDCLNIINGLRERLCQKLQVDIPDNDIDVEPVHLIEDDNENQSKIGIETAMAILGECSGRGYERIRKEMMVSIAECQ